MAQYAESRRTAQTIRNATPNTPQITAPPTRLQYDRVRTKQSFRVSNIGLILRMVFSGGNVRFGNPLQKLWEELHSKYDLYSYS